jgi:MFS family permease
MTVTVHKSGKLGLPDLTGRYSLAGALFTDSLGDGLFVPFAVVYFLKTTALPLTSVGLGLTAASLLALPAAPLSGILVDRLTSVKVVITGNVISAAGFTAYLFVGQLWQLITFAFLAAAGGRLFWTANLSLVGEAFDGAERSKWFAFQRAARNAGYGLGGLLAAAALGLGTGIGYRALALANALSFAVAALLIARWSHKARRAQAGRAESALPPVEGGLGGNAGRAGSGIPPVPGVKGGLGGKERPPNRGGVLGGRPPGKQSKQSFKAPLTDGPFLLLAGLNTLFVLCMVVLDVLLTLYLVRVLHQPPWLSGLCFAANTVGVAGCQTIVWARFAHRRPVRVLQLSAAVWGLSFLILWAVPPSLAIPGVLLAIAVFTAAELIQGPVFNGLVVAAAPEHLRGRYMAVYQLSWALGQAAAPALFGFLFTENHALPWLTLAGGCAACCLVLSTRLGTLIQNDIA